MFLPCELWLPKLLETMRCEEDMDANNAYPWSENDKAEIENYQKWLSEEMKRVDDLLKNGPDINRKWSKLPVNIKKFEHNATESTCKRREDLGGQELHDYLILHCSPTVLVTAPRQRDEFQSLENMKATLQQKFQMVKEINRNVLKTYIDFGLVLRKAFARHEYEKRRGERNTSWKVWLHENVGVSDSLARKIREVTEIVIQFPRLKKLTLPFDEVYRRRKQITTMLTFEVWAKHWRQ